MSVEGLAFLLAALLCFAGGIVHSVFGERRFIGRLHLSKDLPAVLGGASTIQVVRLMWHSVTIACCTAAALFVLLAQAPPTTNALATVLGAAFMSAAVLTAIVSRGRYLAWILISVITLVAFWGGR